MENFIVSDWFASRAKLNIQTFIVENITFELMALNSEQKEEVELCESYDDMLEKAADFGLSYKRKRVIDSELAEDLPLLWGESSIDVHKDPCIKFRVGERVCEISELSDSLTEQLEKEEAAVQAAIEVEAERIRLETEEKEAAARLEVESMEEAARIIDGDTETPEITLGQLEADANYNLAS